MRILWIILSIIIYIVSSCIIANASLTLQEKKGYNDGFIAWAFLFGTLYLIYSAGLPLKKDDYELKYRNNKKANFKKTNFDYEESDYYEKCAKCGYPVYEDETNCFHCGNPNKNYKKD